ncbi:zf-HC2 domain-containing protein [Georgenia sp. M64]|uniref:zf-HC2 domain-containing protein n=1 Tax=Georgenia sp. M64 TaxID=3120520 RepID=UPI0030E52E9C
MSRQCPDQDELYALALGDVGQPERDAVTAHLAVCEGCRAEYTAIADAADHVLAAAPAVAPPAGFSSRVLAAMAAAGGAGPAARPSHPSAEERPAPDVVPARADVLRAEQGRGADTARPATAHHSPTVRGAGPERPGSRSGGHHDSAGPAVRHRRRRWPALLTAAVAGVLLGVAGTAVLTQLTAEEPPPAAAPAETAEPARSAGIALVKDDGTAVGSVSETWFDGQPVLVVAVTDGPPGALYECWLVGSDGTRESAGRWSLDEYGAEATWIVPVPEGRLDRLELVAASGRVWSTASL